MEIGVEDSALRELAAQEEPLLRDAPPVLEHHEAGARTREPADILVHHVKVPCVRDAALHGNELVKLQVWMEEEDSAAPWEASF